MGRRGRHTISEAHWSAFPVTVTSAQKAGTGCEVSVQWWRRAELELSQVKRGIVFVSAGQANQVVEHFRDSQRCQDRIFFVDEQFPDFARGGLALQKGEHCIRIENDHRRRSREASSVRA